MRRIVVSCLLTSVVVVFETACGESHAPRKAADQGVPANSLSDARLHGRPTDGPGPAQGETSSDPTLPYTMKVGEAPLPEPESSDGDTGSVPGSAAGKPGGKAAAGSGKGVVSKTECDRVMDRYIELETTNNPQLKGLPRDVIEQAKETARQQHGEMPCTATRAQYTCAMAATTTAAWQRCLR